MKNKEKGKHDSGIILISNQMTKKKGRGKGCR